VTSDGPGSLNDLAGHKVVGPWFLEMIDSSPGQTGRVQRFEIAIVPLNENLEIGTLITGSVDPGQMAFYPLETPPGATNINFLFSNVSGPLEFYWREGALPTTNLFDFNRSISPPGANFSLPVQPNRTYYMGLRNPGGSVVNFTLLLTAQFADADYNHFLDDRILDDVLDVATTNSVIDVNEDKLVSDLRVGVQMKHPRTADIALTLISPQGSRILLAENRGYTNGAGFGSSSTVTNRAPDGTTYITNRAEYVIFTEHTNLARIPVKFANPGTTNSLGSVGVAFASSFEGSVLAGNYQSGTVLASGWRVSGGGQISVINGPRLAHTGDTLMSLGTGGLTRQIPLTSGRSYTVRFAARKGPLMDFLSTGVDATRAPIPPGTPDPNYFIIPDTLSAYVLDTNASVFLPPASWNTNDNRSQWIAPYYQLPATNTEGQIVFRTYINLYEHPSPVAYSRQFRWSGDDVGSSIRVNGASFAFAGAPSSNFFGSSTYSVSGLRNGLNWVDFFVENTNDVAAGLRVEVLPAPPWTKVAAPQMIVSIGGVSQTITVGDNWSEQELTFVPTSSSGTLTLQSSTGEVWVDSVIVESSGGTFLQPEESFELLEGERAMGEWRLEVRDTRSGAVLQTRDFLQWSLELSFADTFNPALRMQPGDISGPITIGSEEVQWVVLDPCQGATFARLRLRGIGNFDELAMLADLSGFPTGLPENDDFLPMWNNENPGQLNGVATFEISSLMPAPARMTGKPIFIGIINQFVGVTNQFELEFISDGNCTLAGPPPILTEDNPATGSLDPNTSGSGSTNNAGVFQFIVPPQARAAIITVVSDGDVTVYGQKDTIPTTSTFSYRVDAVPGAGTEILRIDGASTPALTPGDYFIRIANDSAQRVNFTVSLS
ncbi:MAG: proprotein convertase P-domain-containing protein, partial [Limisphaerales bacterium]